MFTKVLYIFLGLCVPVFLKDAKQIMDERNNMYEGELNMMIGSDIVLSDNEEEANKIIMRLKNRELDEGFHSPQYFNCSKHFFDYKEVVKNSPLFEIIQSMPKGAVLHAHDTSILKPEYVLSLTYSDNLYVCFVEDDVHFLFSNEVPINPCDTKWQLLRDVRYASGNVAKFDDDLIKHFTIVVDNPEKEYSDINAVWHKLQRYFITTSSLFSYKPIWEKYFYDALKAFREENVMYIEIRSVLPHLYDLKGNVYDSVATAESYKNVSDQFVKDYPDFYGAKLIYAPVRKVDADALKKYICTAKKIKKVMPDFLAGFDLVGQEDLGEPTKYFLPLLAEAADELDYFFHAGETNWNGLSSDENLFDAIALGSKRLGHAFALIKHPLLLEEVKKKDIAVEVNVISNSVLKLVADVRNHPLAALMAQDVPVVISSDDPGVWEAEPLSHDFYVTFVGVSSRHADLRVLKKLALNSLYYSTITNKDKVIYDFEIRWTKFINELIKQYEVGLY